MISEPLLLALTCSRFKTELHWHLVSGGIVKGFFVDSLIDNDKKVTSSKKNIPNSRLR